MRLRSNIPWWKHLLSYFIEIELEKLDSEISGPISVCLSDGRMQLNAKRAIYSWEDKYDNFDKSFHYVFKGEQEKLGRGPKKVPFSLLVLGYGMGSIPLMLEKKHRKQFECTAIELDEDVIYLAEKYGTSGLSSSVQIIQAPAEVFVEITEEQYDMICIDVFVKDRIPAPILTPAFIQQVYDLLENNGYIFFNHLSNKPKEVEFAQKYFENAFEPLFKVSELLDVGGNHIMIGRKG